VPEQLVVAHGSDGSIGAVRLSTEASGSLIGAASTSSGNAATNLIHHAHILVPTPPRNPPPTYPFPTLIDWSKIVIDMAVEKLEPQGLLSRLLHMSPQEVAERQRLLRHSLHWLTYDLKNHSHHDAPAALIHTIQGSASGAIAHFSTLSPGLRGDQDACMHHAMKETGSVLLFEGFLLRLTVAKTPSPRLGTGGGWAGFAGGGLYFRVGPKDIAYRSSRGRAGA
jgi:hypothetical protein